jgi:hypothetical protein
MAAALVIFGIVVGLVALVWLRRDALVRRVVKERFVATMRGGESFEGLLLGADAKTFRFADAWALDGKDRVSVDGELYLPRGEVLYLQKPGVAA